MTASWSRWNRVISSDTREIAARLNYDIDGLNNNLIERDLSTEQLFILLEKYTSDRIRNDWNGWTFRFHVASIFGWSIPCKSALEEVKNFVKDDLVLEIAAGRGLWSALMRSVGINVICTSIIDGEYYNKEQMEKTWTDIELLDCEKAVEKYRGANCLFLSWGSGNSLYKALDNFIGHYLIVIGELNGCTDDLRNTDDSYTRYDFDFVLVKEVDIPQWPGMKDKMYFYSRSYGPHSS